MNARPRRECDDIVRIDIAVVPRRGKFNQKRGSHDAVLRALAANLQRAIEPALRERLTAALRALSVK